jgi:co-chaperonin GroES (HSP10)
MRPLRNNIVVTRIAADKVSASGIILTSSEGPDKAKVEAIGPLVDEVAVGEIVQINWNKATKFQDENFIVPIDDVVFVFEE